MTRDDAAPLPGDLLLQAVEGMERPLFVLDDDWRFSYMNPAGAALLGETVDGPGRRGSSGRSSRRRSTARSSEHYRRVADDRRAGQLRGLVRAAADLVPGRRVPHRRRAGRHLRRRHRATPHRGRARRGRRRPRGGGRGGRAAAAEAEEAGRHLMLLGDINLAMTSTLDTDEAVDRFAHLVVPLLADWCLVSVFDPDGTRRDVGRAHRDPAMVDGDAPLRRPRGWRPTWPTAPVPTAAARPPAGGHPRAHAPSTSTAMVGDARGRARRWSRCGPPPSPPSR